MSENENAPAKSEVSRQRRLWADFVEKGLLIRPVLADSISLIWGGIGHDGQLVARVTEIGEEVSPDVLKVAPNAA